jgi:DNA-binding PadR family transcriptional regulator/polyisoprenoid-binding protein YceI
MAAAADRGRVVLANTSRFELAPPRRFVLPALLLLLSERPAHGYGLAASLREWHFGHVDRPAIYRALAQLERDGLVEGPAPRPGAGSSRRVHRITPLGERVLREWMGVIKQEHDSLGEVLRRYHATGTTDAVLAEVEGGWATALGFGWSPVGATRLERRRLVPLATGDETGSASAADGGDDPDCGETDRGHTVRPAVPTRYRLRPDRSVVLVEVRSTAGPLSFGAIGVRGYVEAAVVDGRMLTDPPPSGELVVDMTGLRSGNGLYDAELHRRIDARRYPSATVELSGCAPSGPGSRYRLEGRLTFHGVTRTVEGAVTVEALTDGGLLVTGEQALDIRDFTVPSPTALMLRIYPDLRVRLQAEAEPDAGDGGP